MRTKIVIIAIILLSAISIKAQDFDFEIGRASCRERV